MSRLAFILFASLTLGPVFKAAEVPVALPFLPAGPAAPVPATPVPDKSGRWELAGIIGTREAPTVRIHDTIEKDAAWLRAGDSFGPLKLISADVEAGTAVIQIGTERLVLGLRLAGVAPGEAAAAVTEATRTATTATAMPPPLPSSGDPAADAKRDQDIAEREARMLVSDLLEISMVQRKAYEEKQAAETEQKAKLDP